MTPARAVRSVPAEVINELLSLEPKWSEQAFKGYQVWHCTPQLGPAATSLFEKWKGAFMVRVPPGGKLLKHSDGPQTCKSYHLPVASNDQAVSLFEVDGEEIRLHLEVGTLYEYDRATPHWAENNGETDRIHLVCEVYQ